MRARCCWFSLNWNNEEGRWRLFNPAFTWGYTLPRIEEDLWLEMNNIHVVNVSVTLNSHSHIYCFLSSGSDGLK